MLILLHIWFVVRAMAKITQDYIRQIARDMRYERDNGRPFAFLTGSGCSKPAGIPTAPEIVDLICKGSLGANIISKLGGSKLTGKNYGEVMGCLSANQRKDFFAPILKEPKINFGHIALASLMQAGYVGRVLTFNFDSILVRAAAMLGFYPAIYDFGVSPAKDFDHIADHSVLHLHGQGFGQVLKNTAKDTLAHAKDLRLLFNNTLQKSGLIVVGYSGEADAAFPQFKESCHENKNNPFYWCNFEDSDAPQHVVELLETRRDDSNYWQDVDFDVFAVQLAQELGCFSLKFFNEPARHMLDVLNPLVPPPEKLPGVQKTMSDLKSKLEKWAEADVKTPSDLLNEAMLVGDWEAAIALQGQCTSENDKELLAWAFTMRGNILSYLANQNQDETLFQTSFEKYATALKIKPDMFEAMNNWGFAISQLARLMKDEKLFQSSFEKFSDALYVKPDYYETLSNWGSALLDLARLNQDEMLFEQSIEKYSSAFALKADDQFVLNNWGNALSELAKLRKDEELFLQSFRKYAAAINLSADYSDAYSNLGAAKLNLYILNGDANQLGQAETCSEKAEKISGKPNYNLACAYALQSKEADCQSQLLKCKAVGILPKAADLRDDEDMKVYRDRDWFKELLAG
jgi:tetratricopeptide (TPR) repeat protein